MQSHSKHILLLNFVNKSTILMQVLLSRIILFDTKGLTDSIQSGLQMYRTTAEAVMCGLLPDSPTATKSRTDSNSLHIFYKTWIIISIFFSNLPLPPLVSFC